MYCYENEDMALLLMALITMIGTRSSFTDVFVVREFTIYIFSAGPGGGNLWAQPGMAGPFRNHVR